MFKLDVFKFFLVFRHYLADIIPALGIGFFLSGLIHEFIPTSWVEKNLGKKGFKPILSATITGALLPICCWGVLPVAVSLYKKGSKLGPVLAFLVATPATSVSALIVTYKLLGLKFAVFIFFAVILMGILMGIIGNWLTFKPARTVEDTCPHCQETTPHIHKRGFLARIKSVFKFAFWDMPKEIGLETLLGIVLAAIVATFVPLGLWIRHNLSGFLGYIFAVIFGLVMYICATATVPLVDAFIKQGLSIGAGMTLLLVGPITSYGTILVLKKEFGMKILLVYLLFISVSSLILGYLFSLI
ncbi:MAG: permease [Candidatus Omnitrophota bacterium]|nr:permease [Candidatus Omnitrophota bacterium]